MENKLCRECCGDGCDAENPQETEEKPGAEQVAELFKTDTGKDTAVHS